MLEIVVKLIGHLDQTRYGHGVIQQASGFTVVGGSGNHYHEYCTFSTEGDEQIICEKKDVRLNGWLTYPELYHVNESYCQK